MSKDDKEPDPFTLNQRRMLTKYIKSILLTSAVVVLNLNLMAQNPGFVQTDVIKVANITTDAQINTLPLGNIQTSRVFIDGLGRPVQSVALQASPVNNKDLVQPQLYNTLGQQTTTYLPYTDNSTINPIGSFRTTSVTDQLSYYQNSATTANPNKVANETTYPFGQRVFENSPLQRVLEEGMAGTGFQISGGKYKTVSYRLNNSTQDGNIMIWSLSGVFNTTYYADNSLSVTDGTDEDGLETRVFTDAGGRTILKRQINSGSNLDTYYIYNIGGVISYIIPPKALAQMASSGYSLTGAIVSTMVFVFAYDGLGRMIEKTVPAKGKISIVYDPLNRPVLVQDANMLANNQWNYIRYDIEGRAVSQGIYIDATRLGRSAMQTYVSGLAYTTYYESRSSTQSTGYYTANVFPTTATGTLTPLAYAYFDDYKLNPTGTAYSYVLQGLGASEETATTAPVKSIPTMVRKVSVGTGLSNTWLLRVTFYDKRLNPIQTQSNNQLNYTLDVLTDNNTSVPDFTGVPKIGFVKKVTGAGASNTVTVQTNLTYDYMYRIKSISQNYNGGSSVTVASYSYNEMGQLVQKGLGLVSGTTYLQNLDMRYNIRGWLTSINNSTLTNDSGTTNTNGDTNDVFGMQILYDQPDSNVGNTAKYDGRISAVKWMSLNSSGTKSYERAYKYTYDGISRYTSASYSERAAGGSGSFSNNLSGFDEMVSYDAGGDITGLTRNSSTQGTNTHSQIDNLSYIYKTTTIPNQLSSVSDASGSSLGFIGGSGTYNYDANGNLTNEPYKGIAQLHYNYLNKTDKITFTVSANRYLEYTYDANGSLIRKRQYDNVSGVATLQNITDYIDGFVYLNGTLQYFPMAEGRVINTGSGGTVTLSPVYTITDYQGNVRVEFDNSGTGGTAKVRQENSYYPTGLIMANSPVAMPGNDNKQLYNGGSEWQKDFSNLPDYYQTYYRNYDAALARWVAVDPEAESAESMTPYQYAGNNAVMMNDPLGNKVSPPPVSGIPWQHNSSNSSYYYQDWLNGGEIGPLGGRGTSGGGGGSGGGNYSAFWEAALGGLMDIMSSLKDGERFDITGSTLGQLAIYENAVTLGLITPNNSGNGASSAAGPTGVSTDATSTSVRGANQDHGPFEIKRFGHFQNGALIEIDFTPPSNYPYESYGWISTVDAFTSDPKNPFYGEIGPQCDHLPGVTLPFYTLGTEFDDNPWSSERFTAWTTLVGFDANGRISPLGTFKWGYTYNTFDGTTDLQSPQSAPIDEFTQSEIDKYNAQKH